MRLPVLARSISCDDGVLFDVICDGCGTPAVASAEASRDRQVLLRLARRMGWTDDAETHRCPACATATPAVVGAKFVR